MAQRKNKDGEPEAEHTKIWFPNALANSELINISRMRLGTIIQFTTGHNSCLRHRRYYLPNTNMDQTCRLCKQKGSREDSIHIWSECTYHKIQTARNKATALSRLKIKKASSSEARTRLANSLINFNFLNFVWSPAELCQFLMNDSIAQLMNQRRANCYKVKIVGGSGLL